MQVRNPTTSGSPEPVAPSIDEINARIADARRAQSRTIARLVSSYFGALERHARSRPRLID